MIKHLFTMFGEIVRYFETFDVNSDEDGDNDLMPFDRRAEQMLVIVEDGGVKKNVSISFSIFFVCYNI